MPPIPARPSIDADPLPPLKFSSALVLGAVLFIVALAVSAGYELDRSRMEAEQQSAREIDALARVFAEQTRRTLQTVDIMLRSVAVANRDGTLPPLDSRRMHEQLVAQRDQFSDVTALFITDAQGMRLNSSTSYPSARASVAGSTLIQGLQTRPAGDAYVGESVRGIVSGRWLVPLARRLDGRDGHMEGVVGALMDASYFNNFYTAVHLSAAPRWRCSANATRSWPSSRPMTPSWAGRCPPTTGWPVAIRHRTHRASCAARRARAIASRWTARCRASA
jgi:hypothetical protein